MDGGYAAAAHMTTFAVDTGLECVPCMGVLGRRDLSAKMSGLWPSSVLSVKRRV